MLHSKEISAMALALAQAQGTSDRFLEADVIGRMANAMSPPPRNNASHGKSFEQRFYEKVVFGTTGCWHWRGAKHKLGYGLMAFPGESKAHRISWRIHRGDIPAGLFVLHRCDVRGCVNPDHLFLGTQADNMADASAKGRLRSNPRRGVDNPLSRLTENQVREIRAIYPTSGESMAEIAARFGVAPMTVCRIINRNLWRHV